MFRHLNVNALLLPVSGAALRRWRRAAQQSGTWSSPWVENAGERASGLAGMAAVSVLIPTLVLFRTADLGLAALALLVPVAGVAVTLFVWERSALRLEVRACRLDGFAADNGLRQRRDQTVPGYPGMILTQGVNRRIRELLQTPPGAPRFVEFGNFECEIRQGRRDREHTTVGWGYVAIRLEHALPNIVLDARGNDTPLGSNLPLAPVRGQRLHLEGDFDRYFSLYAPDGYELDALYLFAPDVMATFIDQVAFLDAEIVDHWLLLYSPHEVVTLDPARWAKLFAAVAAVDARLGQWARWRDERLPEARRAPVVSSLPAQLPVAPAGRRLRVRPGQRFQRIVLTLVWLAIVVAFALLTDR
ncbi:MAG: hypothetical protein ABF811_00390 [Pseudoclavibacter sp.]